MTALERLVAAPRLLEIHRLDLAAPPSRVWERVRHGDLAVSPLVRALIALRTRGDATSMDLDDMVSTPERPGFQLLVDRAPHELVAGAIGKVWCLDIPFVHVAGADAFVAFDREGYVKVAWSIRLAPEGDGTHLELELRVDATDDASWRRFRRYFLLIGPGSRYIRRSLLRRLARELGRVRSGSYASGLHGSSSSSQLAADTQARRPGSGRRGGTASRVTR